MNFEKAFAPVTDKLIGWAEAAIKMLPNIVVAMPVLLFFWVLSVVIGRLFR